MLTHPKPTVYFQATAGALLLAMASALFLINGTSPADLVTPHDPVLGLSMNTLYWIIGGLALAMALACLFDRKPFRSLWLLAWLATNFLVYRLGLIWVGCRDLTGFLGGFTYTFGMPAKAVNVLAQLAWGYLLVGSYAALLALWLGKRPVAQASSLSGQAEVGQASSLSKSASASGQPPGAQSPASAYARFLKITCPACGGHIEFPEQDVGRKIPCPHCKIEITLAKPISA